MDLSRINILLVEDDEVDAESVIRAFTKRGYSNLIINARDGYEALDVLKGKNGVAKIEEPYIILLDINMPRMNGLELLSTIRRDDELDGATVFVLTTSSATKDVRMVEELGVSGYLLKTCNELDYGALFHALNSQRV